MSETPTTLPPEIAALLDAYELSCYAHQATQQPESFSVAEKARRALETAITALVRDGETRLSLARWMFRDAGQRFLVAITPSGETHIDGGHSGAQGVAKARELFRSLDAIRLPEGTRFLMLTVEEVPPFTGRLNEEAVRLNNLAAAASTPTPKG